MGKFDYTEKFSIAMPKVTVDTKASKKERTAAKARMVKAHQAGVAALEKALGAALDQAMKTNWPWPRGGPRDIVETGALLRSRKIKTQYLQTKAVIGIQYTSPYAALMYYGGLIQPYGNRNAASVLIPARPWIEAILQGTYGMQKFEIAKPYDAAFKNAWKAGAK